MTFNATPTSDDDLYALLGLSVPDTAITNSEDRLTRTVDRPLVADGSMKIASTEIEYPNNARQRRRARRSTPVVQRPSSRRLEEDSDEPIKETVHITPKMRSITFPKVEAASPPPRVDAYWMYGQGLEQNGREVVGQKHTEDIKEEVEVKEKDFAEHTVVKKELEVAAESADLQAQIRTISPACPQSTMDLLAQLMQSIKGDMASHSGRIDSVVDVKQEEMSVEMAKIPTSSTADEGLTTADESFYTDTENKIPRRFHVVQHQTRVKGSSKRRYRYQIVKHTRPSPKYVDMPPAEEEVKIEPDPLPETAFQRDVQSTFSRSALLQVNELAKVDNTSGNHLPSHLRDLFPALSDPASAITVANHLRRQFDLPLLSTKTDRVALRRSVAQMRLNLYTELVSALILPSAPIPAPDTDDEEERVKSKKISLVPSALQYMQKALPTAFPNEKYPIKLYLANHDVLGEIKGKVVWQDGIGKMVGGDPNGPAFRGKVTADGLVHVFVDHSNVLHGLSGLLRKVQSSALPPKHLRTLSLPILSLLLRRGRPTPHGSLHLVASSPIQQNLDPLVRLGWEVSVLKRVEIYDDEVYDSHSAKLVPKPQGAMPKVNGFHEGGSRRYKEQGVDEILHLKILQALNTKPTPAPKGSTIVLATGDAKGGQFNQDGFLGAVREAIKRGWSVELWSFSEGLSRAWKDIKKKENWAEHFTIKLLDEWAEQLVEVGDGD